MSEPAQRRNALITAVCGVLFVAALAAGVILVELNAPTGSTVSDAKIVSYYADHKSRIEAGAGLGALAVFFLLIYISGLRNALERAEGEDGRRLSIVGAAGSVAAAFTGLYFVFSGAIPGAMDYAKPFTINPNTARLFNTLPYWCMVFVTVATSVLVGASALSGRRTGALPRWLAVAGIVLAVAALASGVVGFPIGFPVLALWALATSVTALARSRARRGAGTIIAGTGANATA